MNHEAFEIAYYLDYLRLHPLVELWQGKDEQFKIIVMSTSIHIYDMEQAQDNHHFVEIGDKIIKLMKN